MVGVAQQSEIEPELLLRFSSLTRLLRVIAWCRRWLHLGGLGKQSRCSRTESSDTVLSAFEIGEAQEV